MLKFLSLTRVCGFLGSCFLVDGVVGFLRVSQMHTKLQDSSLPEDRQMESKERAKEGRRRVGRKDSQTLWISPWWGEEKIRPQIPQFNTVVEKKGCRELGGSGDLPEVSSPHTPTSLAGPPNPTKSMSSATTTTHCAGGCAIRNVCVPIEEADGLFSGYLRPLWGCDWRFLIKLAHWSLIKVSSSWDETKENRSLLWDKNVG